MKLKTIIVSLILVACSHGQSIVENAIVLDSGGTPGEPFGQYSLTVFQDAGQTDTTSIFFDKDSGSLTFRNSNLDEGSDWFFVDANDIFDASALASPFSGANQSFAVPVSGEFYLAVSTGLGFSGIEPNRTVRGWARFNVTASTLDLISSAVAYDAASIQVGTTIATPIPEPSAFSALVGIVCGFAVFVRRRKNA